MKYLVLLILLVGCGNPILSYNKGKCYTLGKTKYSLSYYGKFIIDNEGYAVQYTGGENTLYGTPNELSVFYKETKCPSNLKIDPVYEKTYKKIGIYKKIQKLIGEIK